MVTSNRDDIVIHRPKFMGSTEAYLDELRDLLIALRVEATQIEHMILATEIAYEDVATGKTLEMQHHAERNVLRQRKQEQLPAPVEVKVSKFSQPFKVLSEKERERIKKHIRNIYIGNREVTPNPVKEILERRYHIELPYHQVASMLASVKKAMR